MDTQAIAIAERLLPALARTLIDRDETITGMIATSNATGFVSREENVHEAFFETNGSVTFLSEVRLSGSKRHEECGWNGDAISILVQANAERNEAAWNLIGYIILQARMNNGDEMLLG